MTDRNPALILARHTARVLGDARESWDGTDAEVLAHVREFAAPDDLPATPAGDAYRAVLAATDEQLDEALALIGLARLLG